MKHNKELEIGAGVYRNFKPAFYGKVLDKEIRDLGGNLNTVFYFIRWKNGEEEWCWYLDVRSLDDLIADHEKKLKTHRQTLAKALAL